MQPKFKPGDVIKCKDSENYPLLALVVEYWQRYPNCIEYIIFTAQWNWTANFTIPEIDSNYTLVHRAGEQFVNLIRMFFDVDKIPPWSRVKLN